MISADRLIRLGDARDKRIMCKDLMEFIVQRFRHEGCQQSDGEILWQLGKTLIFMKEELKTKAESLAEAYNAYATKISKTWRGWRCYKRYKTLRECNVQLQAIARVIVSHWKFHRYLQRRVWAASRIQSWFRRTQTRLKLLEEAASCLRSMKQQSEHSVVAATIDWQQTEVESSEWSQEEEKPVMEEQQPIQRAVVAVACLPERPSVESHSLALEGRHFVKVVSIETASTNIWLNVCVSDGC